MKAQIHLFILIGIYFYSISSTAQIRKTTYSSIYDLNFTMKKDTLIKYPWRENAAYANYTIPTYKKDSDCILYTKVYLKGFPFYNRLMTECEQRILLPYHDSPNGSVKFKCKGNNLESIFIILDGINKEERKINSDTLKFRPKNNEFTTVSKNISLENIDLLNIRINAKGKINQSAYITFCKFNLFINGKTIDQFPIREPHPIMLKEELKCTPIDLKTGKGLEEITDLKNKKIIALGESIHGNNSIKKLVNQIIYQTIKKQNCNLILLERPLEKTLSLNRFIQSSKYKIDSIEILEPETRSLLNNLRIYNSDRKNKIKLLGMDYNSICSATQNSSMDLFDYITQLNKDIKNTEVDKFAILLMKKNEEKSIKYLKEHRINIQKVLTADEVDCIFHILNLSKKIGKDNIKRFFKRDSVMFLNTKFLIEKLSPSKDSKTIIYGHAIHINPISTFPAAFTKSLGTFFKIKYKEEYSSFLLSIGKGSAKSLDSEYNQTSNLVKRNPKTSIEYFLSSLNKKTFYTSTTTHFNKLTLSRFKGQYNTLQEFYPFNLYQRYNGIFFISKGSNKQKKSSFKENSKHFRLKVKRRKIILEEIKQRLKNCLKDKLKEK